MIKKNKLGKDLILGIGNTIRGDDGAGIYLAQALKKGCDAEKFEVLSTDTAGFSWLDLFSGYRRVIIIDSIKVSQPQIGQVFRISASSFKRLKHPNSFHQFGLNTILGLGKKLKVTVPSKIEIYAIGINKNTEFSDQLSSGLKQKIKRAARLISSEIIHKRRSSDGHVNIRYFRA